MTDAISREDVERACRLISWMANYIGKMAPGAYSECYAELNDHFLSMGRAGILVDDPSKSSKPTE